MKIHKSETTNYTQMGMAALLPGMIHAHKILGEQIARMQAELKIMQNGAPVEHDDVPVPTVSLAPRVAAGKNGWSDDPAERSAEMKRRLRVARRRKAARERWDGMSASKRKAHLAKMEAGRLAKKEARA